MLTSNGTNVDGFQLVSLPSRLHLPHPSVFPSLNLSQHHLYQCLCVYVHVCVSGVEMECRRRQAVSLGPLHLLCWCSQPTHLSHPLGKRKRGREKRWHTCIRASLLLPPQLVSYYKHFSTVFLSCEVLDLTKNMSHHPNNQALMFCFLCTNININKIFILYLYIHFIYIILI